jgi:hypothetical protein
VVAVSGFFFCVFLLIFRSLLRLFAVLIIGKTKGILQVDFGSSEFALQQRKDSIPCTSRFCERIRTAHPA